MGSLVQIQYRPFTYSKAFSQLTNISFSKVCHFLKGYYKDITLQVILKSGNTHPKINCSWFHIYSPAFLPFTNPSISYDAHVQLYYSDINNLRIHENRVSPESYVSFIDDKGGTWNIINCKELNNIPESPGLSFGLKKQGK